MHKNNKWLEKIYYDKLMLFSRKTIVKRDKRLSPDKFYRVYKVSTKDDLFFRSFSKEFKRDQVKRMRGLKPQTRRETLRRENGNGSGILHKMRRG